jgi:hypothetical protein
MMAITNFTNIFILQLPKDLQIYITIEGIFIFILFTICSKKCPFKRSISLNHLKQQIIDLRKFIFVGYKFIYIL